MKRYFLLIFVVAFSLQVKSLELTPPKKVFQKTQRGGVVFLSNVGLYCAVADTNALPPSVGSSNDNFVSQFVDRDKDPTTFMSSSDSLELPPCSDITFACLFWGGHAVSSTPNWNLRNKVKIKANNNDYIDIVADEIGYHDQQIYFKPYYCYKDVTSLVKKYGVNTRWTVANVVGQTGEVNRFSGWNMIIVYKNEDQLLRQLTVFNSVSIIEKNTQTDIKLTGFKTPNTGSVSFEMGVFAYDGDRPNSGDQLLLKGGKKTSFQKVFDDLNDSTNVFNSTISNSGALTTHRIPNFKNNYSIDADIFKPDNTSYKYIANGDTTLTVRLTTLQDVYLTQAVSLVVDANIPDNRLGMRVNDLNGGVVQPGDTLEYTLVGTNVGTDKSVDTYITNTIEKNAVYVPNSIRITYGPNSGAKTDASNDDQADFDAIANSVKVRIGRNATGLTGGEVDNSPSGADSTVVKFRVTVAVKNNIDCAELLCDNIVDNHAYIHGKGKDSGIEFVSDQVPPFFDNTTCSVGDISNKTSVIVYTNCPDKKAELLGTECSGSDLELQGPIDPNATYEWSGPNKFSSTNRIVYIKNSKQTDSGDYILKMSNAVTNCHSYFIVQVKVNENSIANAGQDQSICTLLTQLNGKMPVSGQGTWREVPINSSGVKIHDVNSPTSQVEFTHSGIYKFEWKLPDTGCKNIPDTVIIRVGLDCPPILDNEYHTIKNDSTASGCLIGLKDKSNTGGKLSVNFTPIISQKNGVFTFNSAPNDNGCYKYEPNPGFVGSDTLVFEICDGGVCSNDTIFITVLAPLILDNETHVIKPGQTATGDLTDSGDVSFNNKFVVNTTPVDGPMPGAGIVIQSDGTYTYTPKPGFEGKDTVVVNICDQQIPKQCKNDTIFITIAPNSPLIIKSEKNSVEECHSVGGTIIDINDVVYQNKPIIVAEEGSKSRDTKLGTFSLKSDGTYSYTAKCGVSGIDTLIVNVCDTQTPKQCKNDTLFVTVSLNKPVAVDDLNVPIVGSLSGNDSPTSGVKNSWYLEKDDTPKDDKGNTVGSVVIDPITGNYTFIPSDPNFEGNVTFHYYIVDENNQVSNVATVTINVLPIWIPEGFSPNGDGEHDTFRIWNFDKTRYPNNTINILNRWGNKVYVAHPYNNEWDGTNNQGLSVGGTVLPVGTYFYILDLGTGVKPFRGYVYLSR